MIEILVKRGLGDKQGPDITDALITSVPVALARGATEINTACSDRKILSLSTSLLPLTMPGGLVRMTTYKGVRVGKLKSMTKEYSLSESEFTASCTINVEVVDE